MNDSPRPETTTPIRIVFFGTPDFAVPSLINLARQPDMAIVLVVTQPDRPAGRGRTMTPPPVKRAAEELGLRVWQPETLRGPEAYETIARLAPTVGVVVAYGELIPKRLLDLPPRGFLNVHPSLLPRYRGASPIQAVLLNGDPVTGVSIIVLTPELDAGPIVRQVAIPVEPTDTSVTLGERLARCAAEVLPDTVRQWVDERLEAMPQDESRATYTKPIRKEDGRIDWSLPAERIERMVRAYQPWPGAWSTLQGRRLIVHRATLSHSQTVVQPGCLVVEQERVLVGTGTVPLQLEEIQPEGKRAMRAIDWWRGARLPAGTCFDGW